MGINHELKSDKQIQSKNLLKTFGENLSSRRRIEID